MAKELHHNPAPIIGALKPAPIIAALNPILVVTALYLVLTVNILENKLLIIKALYLALLLAFLMKKYCHMCSQILPETLFPNRVRCNQSSCILYRFSNLIEWLLS